MGKDTRIRWATATWNPMTGCTKISPGCDHCYAETIATRWGANSPAYPNGFDPTFKPNKLDLPIKWADGRTIFVNSMSDVMHADFTMEQRDQVFDVMLAAPQHDYLVLTKRPKTLAHYLTGQPSRGTVAHLPGWLHRRGLDEVPDHIWLGTSIESNDYVWRADWLRRIPVDVRFLSCEPLLGPLPDLDIDGIGWVIVGGESGRGYRPMDHEWAREIRDRCEDAESAFYFKQSAAYLTERGVELDGRRYQEYPRSRMHRAHVASLVERADGSADLGAVPQEPKAAGAEAVLF